MRLSRRKCLQCCTGRNGLLRDSIHISQSASCAGPRGTTFISFSNPRSKRVASHSLSPVGPNTNSGALAPPFLQNDHSLDTVPRERSQEKPQTGGKERHQGDKGRTFTGNTLRSKPNGGRRCLGASTKRTKHPPHAQRHLVADTSATPTLCDGKGRGCHGGSW